MKLVIITAIKEFEKEIRNILIKSDVASFSFQDIQGFRDHTKDSVKSNWFASEINVIDSIMFYAFMIDGNADKVFEHIGSFNEKLEALSRIHISILNIEKSN